MDDAFIVSGKETGAPDGADLSVRIAGDELEPYIMRGGTAFAARTRSVADGEVGIFLVEGRMLCRQFCEDAAGNVYLFTVNRRRKKADVTVPAAKRDRIFCFGRVILPPIPLPRE